MREYAEICGHMRQYAAICGEMSALLRAQCIGVTYGLVAISVHMQLYASICVQMREYADICGHMHPYATVCGQMSALLRAQ